MLTKSISLIAATWLGTQTGTSIMSAVLLAQSSPVGIEDTLKSVASQVPSLVVLVFVVRFFLASMADSRKEYLSNMQGVAATHQSQWAAIHADNIQNRTEMQNMLNRQLITMEKHTEAMMLLAKSVATCPAKIRPMGDQG